METEKDYIPEICNMIYLKPLGASRQMEPHWGACGKASYIDMKLLLVLLH